MLDLPDTSKPLSYTSNTFHLLFNDCLLFVRLSITWPLTAGLLSIVLPFRPFPSGKLDELYPSKSNIWAIVVHGVLFIAQCLFLISLVALLFMGVPAILYFVYIVGFVGANMLISNVCLNGGSGQGKYWVAGAEYAANPTDDGEAWVSKDPAHEGEKWVLINGVAVGSHWLSSNLERLAMTFRRPILAIHNPTYGIPFDVIECILQRTFAYPTLDIRRAYSSIAALLVDPNIKKLVLLAHSQGAIEAGMVLDWLYATMSREQLSKLEVFTFGNAGNHWNCPVDRSEQGVEGRIIKHMEHYANSGDWVARFGILHFRQKLEKYIGGEGGSIVVDTSSASASANSAGTNSTSGSPATALVDSPVTMTRTPTQPQTPPATNTSTNTKTRTSNTTNPDGPGKRHSTFTLESRRTLRNQRNRFVGRLFLRTDCSGHQMNQHYLDQLFPLEEYEDSAGVRRMRVVEGNETTAVSSTDGSGTGGSSLFMGMPVDGEVLHADDTVMPFSPSQSSSAARKQQEMRKGVKTRSARKPPAMDRTLTVKQLSRLWLYRNGSTPEDWVNHGKGVGE